VRLMSRVPQSPGVRVPSIGVGCVSLSTASPGAPRCVLGPVLASRIQSASSGPAFKVPVSSDRVVSGPASKFQRQQSSRVLSCFEVSAVARRRPDRLPDAPTQNLGPRLVIGPLLTVSRVCRSRLKQDQLRQQFNRGFGIPRARTFAALPGVKQP